MPPAKAPIVTIALLLSLCTAACLPARARNTPVLAPSPVADTLFLFYVIPLCTGDVFQGIPIYRDTVLTAFHSGNSGADTLLTWFLESTPSPAFEIAGDTIRCAGQTGRIEVVGTYVAYEWSNGASSKSIDVNAGGWYAVTVTNSLGCRGADSVWVQTVQLQLELEIRNPSCHSLADGFLEVLSTGPQSPAPHAYQLNASGIQASPLFEHLSAGQYRLLVVDAAGCSDSLDIQLAAPAPFEVDIGPDIFLAGGGVHQLSATATAPVAKYQWQPATILDCDTCAMPQVLQPANTAIILKATDPNGCSDADTLQLTYDNTIALYVPNAFTPNNDGMHDHLAVSTGPGIVEIEYFRVFDRWGNLVFERLALPAASLTDLWDGSYGGKRLTPDTFVWTASVRLADRNTAVRSGTITLIF